MESFKEHCKKLLEDPDGDPEDKVALLESLNRLATVLTINRAVEENFNRDNYDE